MKLKRIMTSLLAIGVLLSVVGCNTASEQTSTAQASGAAEPVHLNLAESWGFETFYPIITPENAASGYGITYYLTSFYDTLFTYDANNELVGVLVEDWSMRDDGLVYTFNLKQGVKFSDGSDLTADDVAKSLVSVGVNLGQYNGAYGKLSTIIADAVAVDDYTVELQLTQPYYGTLRELCLPNPFAIVSSEQLNDDLTVKDSFVTGTYGSGPYMYAGDGDGQSYTFVKNPNYWGEAPDVESFTINVVTDNDAKLLALKNGEVDFLHGITNISAESFKEMEATEGFHAKKSDNTMHTYYVGYNLSNPIFEDQVVREAVALAIDKENIVGTIFNNIYEKANTFFVTSLPYCDVAQKTYEFNTEKANAILDEAGYKDTDGDGIREKDGVNMITEFLYQTGASSDDDMVLYICDELKQIGIELTPQSAPMMDWYAMITSNSYGLTIFNTQGGYYDPINVVSNIDPNGSMDPILSQVGEFLPNGAETITTLNASTDPAVIEEHYNTILTTMSDKCLNLPIYYTHQIALYNDSVSDYEFSQDPNFLSVQNIKTNR